MNESDDLSITIHTLLENSLPQNRIFAAHTLITKYDLPFPFQDILRAFYILERTTDFRTSFDFVHTALTKNVNLFIAAVHALLNAATSKINVRILYFKQMNTNEFVLGCDWWYVNHHNIIKMWCILYDYQAFNISNLVLSEDLRNGLQKHIDGKARYTKPAVTIR